MWLTGLPGAGKSTILNLVERRLAERGTDSAEQIDERLRTAEIELAAQEEFPHVVVNDEVERAAAALEGIVREELDSTA